MQKLAAFALVAVLASGLIIAFVLYKQLQTGTETLSGSPELAATSTGAECGDVAFDVEARSLGQWFFDVPKAKTMSGTVSVGGDESSDVGFSIWSPVNRAVFFESERTHRVEFEVEGTVRGAYRFEFDNRHSSFADKRVTVELCLA